MFCKAVRTQDVTNPVSLPSSYRTHYVTSPHDYATLLHFSHDRPSWSSPNFTKNSFQNFRRTSDFQYLCIFLIVVQKPLTSSSSSSRHFYIFLYNVFCKAVPTQDVTNPVSPPSSYRTHCDTFDVHLIYFSKCPSNRTIQSYHFTVPQNTRMNKKPCFWTFQSFCYRHCKLLQAIWKGQMSHSSGSFKRIGGFLESQMSVTTYVSTQTASPLNFEWNRKAQEVGGGSGRGDKWDREEKGRWK